MSMATRWATPLLRIMSLETARSRPLHQAWRPEEIRDTPARQAVQSDRGCASLSGLTHAGFPR